MFTHATCAQRKLGLMQPGRATRRSMSTLKRRSTCTLRPHPYFTANTRLTIDKNDHHRHFSAILILTRRTSSGHLMECSSIHPAVLQQSSRQAYEPPQTLGLEECGGHINWTHYYKDEKIPPSTLRLLRWSLGNLLILLPPLKANLRQSDVIVSSTLEAC